MSKTYSKRTSLTSTLRTRPSPDLDNAKSDLAKLLIDSSDEGESGTSDQDVQLRLLGSRNSEGKSSKAVGNGVSEPSVRSATKKGKEKAEEPVQEGNKGGSAGGTRRKGVSKKVEEDSTNWDEFAVMATTTRSRATRGNAPRQKGNESVEGPPTKSSRTSLESTKSSRSEKPSPPKRQRSLRNSNASSTNTQPNSPSTSAPKPPPPPPPPTDDDPEVFSDPPSPPSRKRRRIPQEVVASGSAPSAKNGRVGETDDDIPPPFDYVPPLARLRSSPDKSLSSTDIIATTAQARPSPVASTSAPIIRTILPSSSSPAKPSPLPSTRPHPSLDIVTTEIQQPASPSIAAKPKRPISPAKDLSSLFSSFANSASDNRESATPMLEVSDAESSSSSRLGLKRSASGGVVAAMAAKRASERNERTGYSRAPSPCESSTAVVATRHQPDKSLTRQCLLLDQSGLLSIVPLLSLPSLRPIPPQPRNPPSTLLDEMVSARLLPFPTRSHLNELKPVLRVLSRMLKTLRTSSHAHQRSEVLIDLYHSLRLARISQIQGGIVLMVERDQFGLTLTITPCLIEEEPIRRRDHTQLSTQEDSSQTLLNSHLSLHRFSSVSHDPQQLEKRMLNSKTSGESLPNKNWMKMRRQRVRREGRE